MTCRLALAGPPLDVGGRRVHVVERGAGTRRSSSSTASAAGRTTSKNSYWSRWRARIGTVAIDLVGRGWSEEQRRLRLRLEALVRTGSPARSTRSASRVRPVVGTRWAALSPQCSRSAPDAHGSTRPRRRLLSAGCPARIRLPFRRYADADPRRAHARRWSPTAALPGSPPAPRARARLAPHPRDAGRTGCATVRDPGERTELSAALPEGSPSRRSCCRRGRPERRGLRRDGARRRRRSRRTRIVTLEGDKHFPLRDAPGRRRARDRDAWFLCATLSRAGPSSLAVATNVIARRGDRAGAASRQGRVARALIATGAQGGARLGSPTGSAGAAVAWPSGAMTSQAAADPARPGPACTPLVDGGRARFAAPWKPAKQIQPSAPRWRGRAHQRRRRARHRRASFSSRLSLSGRAEQLERAGRDRHDGRRRRAGRRPGGRLVTRRACASGTRRTHAERRPARSRGADRTATSRRRDRARVRGLEERRSRSARLRRAQTAGGRRRRSGDAEAGEVMAAAVPSDGRGPRGQNSPGAAHGAATHQHVHRRHRRVCVSLSHLSVHGGGGAQNDRDREAADAWCTSRAIILTVRRYGAEEAIQRRRGPLLGGRMHGLDRGAGHQLGPAPVPRRVLGQEFYDLIAERRRRRRGADLLRGGGARRAPPRPERVRSCDRTSSWVRSNRARPTTTPPRLANFTTKNR